MIYDLNDVIVELAKKSSLAEDPGDVMKLTQSALNLSHAIAVYVNSEIQVREHLDKAGMKKGL